MNIKTALEVIKAKEPEIESYMKMKECIEVLAKYDDIVGELTGKKNDLENRIDVLSGNIKDKEEEYTSKSDTLEKKYNELKKRTDERMEAMRNDLNSFEQKVNANKRDMEDGYSKKEKELQDKNAQLLEQKTSLEVKVSNLEEMFKLMKKKANSI